MNDFWEKTIDAGYYDRILEEGIYRGRGIQPNWHHSTFTFVKKFIKKEDKHLDFACGPGTFIGKYSTGESIGVDISKKQIEYAINKYGHTGNFVTNEEVEKVRKAKETLENPPALKPYFDHLNGEIEYFKIRVKISYISE